MLLLLFGQLFREIGLHFSPTSGHAGSAPYSSSNQVYLLSNQLWLQKWLQWLLDLLQNYVIYYTLIFCWYANKNILNDKYLVE